MVPAESRIRNLRWAESTADGLVLICELDRGTAVALRMDREAIGAYQTDVHFQTDVQRDLREALRRL